MYAGAVFVDGRWHGRTGNDDWKARWIEDGTKVWPKHAILRRTRSQLAGDPD
jgi:hypothetical protein